VTVLEAIQRSADFLAKKGVESPRLQVELLLGHLLKLPRMKLYLNFERELTPAELDALRVMVKRRGEREPLQHIVGSVSFWGLELAVNPHVLIPRPETEILAECAWTFLNGIKGGSRGPSALDFGTGSGCLAIAMAAKCPIAEIAAVDISPEAIAVAKRNAATHKVDACIHFFCGNGFAAIPAAQQFDLVVSNPPYVPAGEIAALESEVRDHDPCLALDGGEDGLDFYHRLASEAAPFLKPGGKIMLELGFGQANAVAEIFSRQKWVVEAVKDDYSHVPRVLIANRAHPSGTIHNGERI
jgi:release factor glutamine methyltransferase